MKRRTKKLFSLLLSLALVVGMISVFGSISYAAGGSESDPVVCTTYEQFKAAMENPSVAYVKINGLNDMISREGESLIAGAVVTSNKTLILSGNSEITAGQGSNLCRVDSLIYVANGGYLSVKGSGSLKFNGNATNASNSVIHIAHDNANVFLYDGITLNGSANGYSYGRAIDLNYGNLTIWGGTYTGDTNMKLVGLSSALLIINGNCKITKGQFTAYDHSSDSNECKGIVVPDGKRIANYLQVNSGYYETGATTTVFEVFTEGPTYSPYEDYGMVSFKLGHAPSDSAFLVKPGQKVENGEYTAIFAGAKPEYYEGIFPYGIYPTPEGQYKVAVKIGDQWYYSSLFTVKYNEESETLTFTTQPKSGTAKKTEPYSFSWALSDTPDSTILQVWVPGENVWRDQPLPSSPATVTYAWMYTDGNISKYRIEATKGSETINSNEFTVTWEEPAETYVDKIVMSLTTPVAGAKPSAAMWCAGAEVKGLTWYRQETTERGIVEWVKMPSSSTFMEGKNYQARIELTPGAGYVFPALTDMNIMLNGKPLGGGVTSLTENEMMITKEYKATAAKANPFVDVTESDYFYEPVLWAVGKGITNGTDDTHFSPNATCTRGQVVTFLWRAAGSPAPASSTNPFTDMNASDYYYNAVLWAVGKDITKGTSPTTFGPNDGCTRGQVVTFLHRFENTPTPASSTNPFVDVSSSEYYYTPVLWAVGKGITNGTDATHFSPNDTCTRGQIVTFLYRDMK